MARRHAVRDRHRNRGRPILAALLAAAAVVTSVRGQHEATPLRSAPAPQVPPALPDEDALHAVRIGPDLRRLVQRLDDDVFSVREGAMNKLSRSSIDIASICALLAENDVSAEQRCRLLVLLEQRLMGAPRGALGISLVARSDELGGIEVLDLVQGMPSQGALRIGDRITHVDGRPVRRGDDLIILIQAKKPGEETVLTVLREKRDEEGRVVRDPDGRKAVETLRMTLQLGSSADLRTPDPGLLLRPGPIEAAREAEMNEAMRRYAPRPVRIRLRAGAPTAGLIAGSLSGPALRSVDEARNVLQEVQIQLLLIAERRLDRDETLTETWRRKLDALDALAAGEHLTEAQREAVRAIADRMAELIAE
jgi:hypothetical protein